MLLEWVSDASQENMQMVRARSNKELVKLRHGDSFWLMLARFIVLEIDQSISNNGIVLAFKVDLNSHENASLSLIQHLIVCVLTFIFVNFF
jgi:hypothetical protein